MKIFSRLVIGALLALLTISVVSAHAKLIKANPAPNAVLGSAPSQIQLWYDEPLDLGFSEVQVLDAQRQRIDTEKLQAVPNDPKTVIVPLKQIGDGSYTVIWKVLSQADGHITRGVFAFGVGETAGAVAAPIDTTNVGGASELTPLTAAVRWLILLALLALVGGFIFRTFLLERSLAVVSAGDNARAVAHKRWLQLVGVAFVFFFAGNLAELVVQTNLIADSISINSIFLLLFNSRYGTLWLLRVGLMVVCAGLVVLEARGKPVPFGDSALIVLGNVALITRSLNSHAAGAGNLSLPVFADWLHMLGVAVWVGGLFCLAWVSPFVWRALEPKLRGVWIAWLVPQFSLIAIPMTFVIFLTGIYGSAIQIPALDVLATRALPTGAALTASTYNIALLAKVVLFFVMLLFGALNLLLLSPRFRKYISEADKSAGLFSRFRATVAAEVALGISAIFLAGVLTLAVPPRSAPEELAPAVAQTQPEQPVVLTDKPAENVQVQLQIGPKPNAPTLFDARVTDADGNALPDVQRVIFNFMYLQEDTGAENVTGEARAENHYVAEGQHLPLEGMWKIKVTVRQKGQDDVAVEFPYYIAPRSPDASSAPVMTAQLPLQKAQAAMNALTSLRSTQALNDGAGNVALSEYTYQAPDRTEFSIAGQGESIAIGGQQYYQDRAGNWTQRARVEPFVFPNFDFADQAIRTRMGRIDKLKGQPAQIILFDTPNTSGDELIHYAYWLDEQNRVAQFGMVATSHYMMQTYRDFNDAAISIAAPSNVSVAPTPAPVASNTGPLSSAVQGSGRPRGFVTGDLEGDGALILVVVGVVILLLGTGGKRNKNTRLVFLGTGAAAILLGIGLFIDAVNAMTNTQNVPVNTTRALSGQEIYAQNCAACHGEKGYGDGPGAAELPVKPFDLTTHVLLHDEQYLHAVILSGRGYMPAFGSKLSQDQILDVIAYARLLARNAQQANPNAAPARPGFTPQP